MENEESKPGTVTIATLILVGLLVPALVASFLVFGLQPSLGSPGGITTSVQKGVLVEIPTGVGSNSSLNYAPAAIKVVVGLNNTITWIQQDPIPHTVTSTLVPNGASSFDSSNMNKGDSFSVTLSVPGTYDYHCTYHPGWMKGSIIVLAQVSNQTVSVILPNGVGSNPTLNFNPMNIVIVIGVNNTVQWVDQDSVPHTVTSISVPTGAKAFDSGPLNLGQTFLVTFTVRGTYRYNCAFHPGWMVGSIVVKASP